MENNPFITQAKERFKLVFDLFTRPDEVFGKISNKEDFDWIQIVLVVLVGIIASLLTGGDLFNLVGILIGKLTSIFIMGVFFMILVMIGKGNTNYIKCVNLVAYVFMIPTLASVLVHVVLFGGLINAVANIFALVLMIVGISKITEAHIHRMIIAIIIFMGIVVAISIVLGLVFGAVGIFINPYQVHRIFRGWI